MVSLALEARANYSAFINKAIKVANVMITHHHHLETELIANRETATRLRNVTVEFRQQDSAAIFGWTERSAEAKVIFVNDVLRDRLAMITQDDSSHECQCIAFIMAVLLFRKCAHLTLRWKNILVNPSKYDDEVGNYMKVKLFGGLTCLKIQKSASVISRTRKSGAWTENIPILDVVIETLDGMKVIRADHLSKFFAPGKLDDKAFFSLELQTYQRTKGVTAHLGRKQHRTPSLETNVMIPSPLCEISPNRNVRKKL